MKLRQPPPRERRRSLRGTRMTAIATLDERHSRFVMLVELPNGHSADLVAHALAERITALSEQLRRSLTWICC